MSAGWNVRVTIPGEPPIIRYYLVYEPDKSVAVGLVKRKVPVAESETAEAVAEIALNKFVGQNMRPGDVKQHV